MFICLYCVICSQLLLLYITEIVSMGTFLKHLKSNFYAYIIFTFYVYLISVTDKCFLKVINMIHYRRCCLNLVSFEQSYATNPDD